MKSKSIFFVAMGTVFLFSIILASVVNAEEQGTDIRIDARAEVRSEIKAGIRANQDERILERKASSTKASSTRERIMDKIENRMDKASSTEDRKDEGDTAKDHERTVSSFVHSLLNIAERENGKNKGIGERVRIIAESQNDSASTTASAMEKVDKRGSFRSFFSGGDYRNLGLIREEIATTTSNIIELKEVLKETINKTDRTELNLQIENLEAERARVTSYVKENENKFSVFGWFNKLFIK